MTITSSRRAANHWPGLDAVPAGPRATFSAGVARRLFAAALSRLDVTVHVEGEVLGAGEGPSRRVAETAAAAQALDKLRSERRARPAAVGTDAIDEAARA